MPYMPPTVAHGDRLGYVRCVPCHEASGVESDFAYDLSNSAIDGAVCESCGELIRYSQSTRGYVRVA